MQNVSNLSNTVSTEVVECYSCHQTLRAGDDWEPMLRMRNIRQPCDGVPSEVVHLAMCGVCMSAAEDIYNGVA